MKLTRVANTVSYGVTLGAGIGFFAGCAAMRNEPRGGFIDLSGLLPMMTTVMGVGAGLALGIGAAALQEVVDACIQYHQGLDNVPAPRPGK